MRASVDAILLRVFVGEDDRYRGRPLYEAIVDAAIAQHMAGATVVPGPDGFGGSRSIRTELNIDAAPHNPMVIEIVDTEDQINRFLPIVNDMIESGLVTMERVRATRYHRADSLEPRTSQGR